MRIAVKLYASLAQHLPAHAKDNVAELDVAGDAAVGDVIAALGLPEKMCHLVLVNGVYVSPGERAAHGLNEGDALAVWPPVAGG